MSNKPIDLTQIPDIQSKIQVEADILAKKMYEDEQKRINEQNSHGIFNIGNDIIQRTNTGQFLIKKISSYAPNHTLRITGIVLFLLLAGASYYFFIHYRNVKDDTK
jgi:hypothetical protein